MADEEIYDGAFSEAEYDTEDSSEEETEYDYDNPGDMDYEPESGDGETTALEEYYSSTDFGGFSDGGYQEIPSHRRAPLEEDAFLANWKLGDRPAVPVPFTGVQGLRMYHGVPEEDPHPRDYVGLFINEDHYRNMAEETNRYARQYLQKHGDGLKEHSRLKKWKETTPEEMKVFIALHMNMGMLVNTDRSEYWGTTENTETPFFGRYMSRDRFWVLITFFHLADNEAAPAVGSPSHSPLWKLGPMYLNIIHRFSTMYKPSQNISVDEGMVPWRGKLRFKVYSPDKPKKYGVKAYMLCDSDNGYCMKFNIYIGKTDEEDTSPGGITYDLVMELLTKYQAKGHHVFMDNYYTSPRLFVNLWQIGIAATGTMRVNRKGLPRRMKEKKLLKGETMVMHNDGLMALKFHDRKVVYLLSTTETATMIDTGKRTKEGGTKKLPQVVQKYNKFMGGVDRCNLMSSKYAVESKTYKWWKRVFFHMLNIAFTNAYVLYKHTTADKPAMTARKFRNTLIVDQVKGVDLMQMPSTRIRGRRPSDNTPARLNLQLGHWLERVPQVGKKALSQKACEVCSTAEKQEKKDGRKPGSRYGRLTTYQCEVCKVALCQMPCNKIYHMHKDYAAAYLQQKYFPAV